MVDAPARTAVMNHCLVYRAGFLGDILLSSSCLHGIRQKHPDCEITYATWRQNIELLALNPHISQVVIPGRYMVSDYMPSVVDIRHESLMADYPDTYWGRLHAQQCAEKGLLDLDEMESFKPEIYIGPDDMAVKKSGKLCVINAWSRNGIGWRLWDIDNWAKLVPELKKMGYKVVHLGADSDPEIPYVDTDLRGKTRLAQVAGVLAVADLCIAIDSFIAHVAHSVKYVRNLENDTIEKVGDSTPTVLLAGPIAPSCVVPEDARCVPVSNYPDCDGLCGVSHPGTEAGKICEYGNSCMKSLMVEQVLEGVEKCQRL